MGCDIHLHIEVKIPGIDEWQHYAQLNPKRNYAAFEKMAGVRGALGNAIARPRGLPDDATLLTKYHANLWLDDAHTPSYLNWQEIVQLASWWERSYGTYKFFEGWVGAFLFGNGFDSTQAASEADDVRFVFWFDN